ncbi:hypothetical protein vseg_007255 [Gypsophila vaccaria]
MEQNVQVMAKKAWHIAKVLYFLLRKNISKRKLLLLELKYLATKRPKLTNHHKNYHHHRDAAYEFSCGNTPCHQNYFSFHHNHKRAHNNKSQGYYDPHHDRDEERELHAVNRVLDMMLTVGNGQINVGDVESSMFLNSPVLPGFGFGLSPMVRQLRVTDSPYLLQNCEDEGDMVDYRVDEAADEFIKRFYDQLKQQ